MTPRQRRCRRAGGAAIVALGVALVGVAWLRTPAGNEALRVELLRLADSLTPGRVEAGQLITDLGSFVELRGVSVQDSAGVELLGWGALRVEVDLGASWRRGGLVLPRVAASGLHLRLDTLPSGQLSLLAALGLAPSPPSTEPWKGLPFPLEIASIDAEIGRITWQQSVIVGGGRLRGRLVGEGPRIDVHALRAAAHLVKPGPSSLQVDGGLWFDPDGLHIRADRVELPGSRGAGTVEIVGGGLRADLDLARLSGSDVDIFAARPGFSGVWTGRLTTDGPFHGLRVTLDLDDPVAGAARLDGMINVRDPAFPWAATLAPRRLHVEALLPKVRGPLRLDGHIAAFGSGARWPETVAIDGSFVGQELDVYGVDIRDGALGFQIRRGQLSVGGLRVAGVAGTHQGTVRVDLVDGPWRADASGNLDLSELAQFGLTGLRGGGPVTLRVSGDWRHTERPLAIDGTVDARGIEGLPGLSFGRLSGPYRGTLRGLDADVYVDATLTGVDAFGARIATATAPATHVTFIDRALTIDARGRLGETALPGGAGLRSGALDLSFSRSAAGVLLAAGALTPDGFDVLGLPGEGGTVGFDLRDDVVSFDALLRDGPQRVYANTGGTFDLNTGRITLGHLFASPTQRGAWVSQGAVTLTRDEHGFRDIDADVVSPFGRVAVGGRWGDGPLDTRVRVEGLTLDVLAEYAPASFSDWSGRLEGELNLGGTYAAPVITGSADVAGLWIPDTVRWLDGHVSIGRDGGQTRLIASAAVAGKPLIGADLSLPLTGPVDGLALADRGVLAGEAWVEPGALERFERVIPGLDLPEGAMSGSVRIGGTPLDPELDPAVLAEVAVAGMRARARVTWHGHRRRTGDSWVATAGEGQTPWITTSGTAVDLVTEHLSRRAAGGETPSRWQDWLDQVDGSIAFERAPVDGLARLAGVDVDVSGGLTGDIAISGTVVRPVGRARLAWEGALGEMPVKARLTGSPVAEGYQTGFDVTFRDGGDATGEIHAGGLVPYTVDLDAPGALVRHGDLDLDVRGERIPLSVITAFSRDVVDPVGYLSLAGEVRTAGEAAELRPVIAVDGEDLAFTWRPLGVRYEDVKLKTDLDDRRIRLEEVSLRSSPLARDFQSALQSGVEDVDLGRRPHLVVTGEILRKDAPEFALDAQARNMWLAVTDALTLQADASVAIAGAWPALTVRGPVNVVQGRVALDTASLASAGPMAIDPVITVHRATPVAPEAVVVEEPPIWGDFDFDLDVDLGRSIDVALALPFLDDLGALGATVTRADLTARVGGSLDVAMQHQVPELNGEVEVYEGAVRVVQARFELDRGKFTFYGDDYSNPRMDVGGTMALSDATIDLAMSGTPAEPRLSFSSAEYPDETQIFTALITGRSPEDLTSSQGVAAAEALGNLLVSSLLSGTQFGSFSMEPDGSLRIGLPVTRSIYAETIVQPNPRPQQNTVTIHGEATLFPRLVLSAAWGNIKSWGDLLWEYRY